MKYLLLIYQIKREYRRGANPYLLILKQSQVVSTAWFLFFMGIKVIIKIEIVKYLFKNKDVKFYKTCYCFYENIDYLCAVKKNLSLMNITNQENFYGMIGTLIKEERVKNGFSQEVLADYLSLTRASIINLEKGRHRPSIHQLIMIANLLNIQYTELIPKVTPEKKVQQLNINSIISDTSLNSKTTKTVLRNFLSTI